MTFQQEIIENIRDEYFISDEAAHEDKEKFQKMSRRLHRSLKKLAGDLYTKETHFVLELIQNADDNDYENPEKSLLRFIVDDNKILVQNNEKGFTEPNVRSICDVGNSSKSKIQGYIGEKGIGFKSVFRVSREPQIFSNGFHFKFEETDDSNKLGYIVPQWIDQKPTFIDGNLTNILLPLKEEAKRFLTKFNEIEPELLLFLQKLSNIEIHNSLDNISNIYRKSVQNNLVKIENAEANNYYKIVEEPLKIPSHIHEEKRDIKESKLILGFPVTDKGTALINSNQKIFAFLPTRPYGFKFIIQADFLVTANREDIHKDKKWNEWLRDQICNVFLKAVETFKKDNQLRNTFYNYIPLNNEIKDDFFSIVVSQLYLALTDSECILTESEKWLRPLDVFRASDEIRSLITNDELKTFFAKEYISEKVETNTESKILDALGVPVFTVDDLIESLKNTDWLKTKEDIWFIKLFSYLEKQSLGKQRLERIKKLKIIRLTDGNFASPLEQKIFFPLSRRQNYGFEKRIPFIDKKVIRSDEKEVTTRIEKFIESLNVFRAKPFEIIENYILPDYENDGEGSWKFRGKEVLLGYVQYIKDNLSDYERESDLRLNSNKYQWQKTNSLGRLKRSLLILYKIEDTNWYTRLNELYLSKEYGNDNNLKFLFSGIEDVRFVHNYYIKSSIETIKLNARKTKESKKKLKEKVSAEIKNWNEFFTKLDAHTKPRISQTIKTKYSPRYAYEKNVTIFSSKEICSILEQGNIKKNIALLRILDTNWHYYNDKKEWVDFSHIQGYNWRESKKASDWFEKLIKSDWIPDTKGVLRKPSSLFIDKPEIRQLLGENVSYLSVDIKNQHFINAISINENVDVETVLEYLKRLVEDNCSDKEKFSKFYSFLDANFLGNENLIRNSFTQDTLIFIPGNVEKYIARDKVLWKDASKILGNHRFYLEKYYPLHKRFFVEKIGINVKPDPKDYADVLCEISNKTIVDKEDEIKILGIYKELNTFLNPDNSDAVISKESWWEEFKGKSIFWTNKSEFWQNENDIFVNDDEDIYKLFSTKPKVAFLKFSTYHPKLQHFIKNTEISYLTEKVKSQLPLEINSIPYEKLTEKIKQLFPYIVRYLYFYQNDIYEKSKEDERLSKLGNLYCYGVDKIEVTYSLNEETGVQEKSHYLNENKLFVNVDLLENYSRVAVEIARIFDNPTGLSDFIYSLFLQPDLASIESYLIDRNIKNVPEDEKQILEELIKNASFGEDSSENIAEVTDTSQNVEELTIDDELPDNSIDNDDVSETNEPDLYELNAEDEVNNDDYENDEDDDENEENEEDEDSLEQEPEITSNGNSGQAYTSKKSNKNKGGGARNSGNKKAQSTNNDEWQPDFSPEDADINISEPAFNEIFNVSIADPEASSNAENQTDFTNGSDEDSTDNNNGESESQDSLSQEDKRKIGRWGEEYSIKCIKKELTQKYQNGKVVETEKGINILVDNKTVASVYWLNKNKDIGVGCDIRIIEKDSETFIEVKATKTDSKEIVQISGKQWRLAQTKQEKFYIYRIYNAGSKQPRLEKICNPTNLLLTGRIIAQTVTLKI